MFPASRDETAVKTDLFLGSNKDTLSLIFKASTKCFGLARTSQLERFSFTHSRKERDQCWLSVCVC